MNLTFADLSRSLTANFRLKRCSGSIKLTFLLALTLCSGTNKKQIQFYSLSIALTDMSLPSFADY